MKKVLSFVLVLAMILGSFASVFAAEFTDVTSEEDCTAAVSVLSDLGIISGYPDGTFQPEKVVTRAEMAAFLVNALGITPSKTNGTVFPDVPYTHWAAAYVDYAQSLGIIAGYTDGTFKPDKTVTYNEAITMVVKALGYRDECLVGTYPASYVNMAMNLGLLDDVQAGTAGAVRGDIAMLVYEAMDKDIVFVSGTGILSTTNKCMFDRHGVTYSEIIIDETTVAKAKIDLADKLGAYAAVWKKSGKVVALEEVFTEFVEAKINSTATKLGDYTIDTFAPYITSTTQLPAALFVNGVLDPATTGAAAGSAAKSEKVIAAVTIDGKHVEVYSIQLWNADAAMLIKTDAQLKNIQKKLAEKSATLLGKSFSMTTDDTIDTDEFTLLGIDSLADLAKGDVVAVYCGGTTTGAISKIEVGRNVVTGKVTKIDLDKELYTVAGTAYEGSSLPGASAAMVIGNEYDVYLDYAGDVYYADGVTVGTNYAILVDKGIFQEAYTDPTYGYKLQLADGTVAEYTSKTNYAVTKGTVVTYTVSGTKLTAMADAAVVKAGLTFAIAKSGVLKDGATTIGYVNTDATVFAGATATGTTTVTIADASSKWSKLESLDAADLNGKDDDNFSALYYALDADGGVALVVAAKAAPAGDFGIYYGYDSQYDETEEEFTFTYYWLVDGKEAKFTADTEIAYTIDGSLQKAKFDVDGDFAGFDAPAPAAVSATTLSAISANTTRNTIDDGGNIVQLDADVVVYRVKTKSDLTTVLAVTAQDLTTFNADLEDDSMSIDDICFYDFRNTDGAETSDGLVDVVVYFYHAL